MIHKSLFLGVVEGYFKVVEKSMCECSSAEYVFEQLDRAAQIRLTLPGSAVSLNHLFYFHFPLPAEWVFLMLLFAGYPVKTPLKPGLLTSFPNLTILHLWEMPGIPSARSNMWSLLP